MRRLDKGMLTSGVGDRCKNKLSRSFGDLSIVNLTPQVQALFNNNPGIMYDYTLSQYLYQDSARTTSVTAIGQPIGSVTDLSPNAKNGSSLGGSRPLWGGTGYSTFDGFDDYMQTAAIDFTGTDAVTVVLAIRKSSDASAALAVEFSANASSTPGTFFVAAPSSVSSYRYSSRGSASANADATGLAAPNTSVITGESDISADSCSIRINGAAAGSSATDQGTGNFGNYVLNLGARNAVSGFLNGRIYRLLVIGRALTTTERNLAEHWAAQPVGIVIP